MTGTNPEAPSRPKPRPLSPHLQIYRWPVTMLTSILHRATGMANAAGLVLITGFLVATAMGPDTFAIAKELLASLLGRLVLFGLTLTSVYHLLNGLRHLAWDTGWGFELKTASSTGILVFILTLAFTLIIWVAAYGMGGAFN